MTGATPPSSAATPPRLTRDLISRILSAPIPFRDDAERKSCSDMIDELSADEMESAARTSYAYHVASASTDETVRALATEETRRRMAMRMARRHVEQKRLHGDVDAALDSLRDTLKFRKEMELDKLRFCFRPSGVGTENGGSSTTGTAEKNEEEEFDEAPCASLSVRSSELPDPSARSRWESLVRTDVSAQPIFARGKDVHSRAVVVKMPRVVPECDEDAYILAHLYIAERACATTEYLSEGREEKLLVVLDFENYGESCRPPFRFIRKLSTMLQSHYPERLDHSVMVEPPFWMRTLFAMMRPFLDPDTKTKMVMVNGEKQRLKKVAPLVKKEDAMAFIRPDGELTSEVDVDRYLGEVPFFAPYYDK